MTSELESLKAAILKSRLKNKQRDRETREVVLTFYEKALTYSLAAIYSELLYYLFAALFYGGNHIAKDQDITKVRVGCLAAAVLIVPLLVSLLNRIWVPSGYRFWHAGVQLMRLTLPIVIAWSGKNLIQDFEKYVHKFTYTFWIYVIVAVAVSLLLLLLTVSPWYRHQQLHGDPMSLCYMYATISDQMALAMGFAWNEPFRHLAEKYTSNIVDSDNAGYYFVRFAGQAIYLGMMNYICMKLTLYLEARRMMHEQQTQCRSVESTDDYDSDDEAIAGIELKKSVKQIFASTKGQLHRLGLVSDGMFLRTVKFVFAWTMSDTLNMFVFGMFLHCLQPTDCSYQANLAYSLCFTILAAFTLPAFQHKSKQRMITMIYARKHNVDADQAKSQAVATIGLLVAALSLSVGWAWKTFFRVLLTVLVEDEYSRKNASAGSKDYLAGYAIYCAVTFPIATSLYRYVLIGQVKESDVDEYSNLTAFEHWKLWRTRRKGADKDAIEDVPRGVGEEISVSVNKLQDSVQELQHTNPQKQEEADLVL